MMKKWFAVAAIFSILMILSISATAQSTKWIKFKRGAVNGVATGFLSGFKSKQIFLLKVRAGQTLSTEQVGSNPITVEIESPDGSSYESDMDLSCHNRHQISPTIAGDYRITVTECRKADPWKGRFRLRVRVT